VSKNKLFFIFLFLIITFFIYSIEPLSDGYKDIKLGMSMDQVRGILEKSIEFNYKKEEILTFRLEPDTEIISTEGFRNYIINAYFHFSHDQLFQIILKLHTKKIGYYNLLKQFTERFGKSTKLSPTKASWDNEKIRIIIEKPCTLKYVYLPIWNGLLKNDNTSDHILDINREKFIDDL